MFLTDLYNKYGKPLVDTAEKKVNNFLASDNSFTRGIDSANEFIHSGKSLALPENQVSDNAMPGVKGVNWVYNNLLRPVVNSGLNMSANIGIDTGRSLMGDTPTAGNTASPLTSLIARSTNKAYGNDESWQNILGDAGRVGGDILNLWTPKALTGASKAVEPILGESALKTLARRGGQEAITGLKLGAAQGFATGLDDNRDAESVGGQLMGAGVNAAIAAPIGGAIGFAAPFAGEASRKVAQNLSERWRATALLDTLDREVPTHTKQVVTLADGTKATINRMYQPITNEVPNNVADFYFRTGRMPKAGEVTPDAYNIRGTTTLVHDPNTGKLVHWSTDNPAFAKSISDDSLSMGLSTRAIKPSEAGFGKDVPLDANGNPKAGSKYNLNPYLETAGTPSGATQADINRQPVPQNTGALNKFERGFLESQGMSREQISQMKPEDARKVIADHRSTVQETVPNAPQQPAAPSTVNPGTKTHEALKAIGYTDEMIAKMDRTQAQEIINNSRGKFKEQPQAAVEQPQVQQPEANVIPEGQAREDIAKTIAAQRGELEKKIYGSSTEDFSPNGDKGAGTIATFTRGIQANASDIVAKGLASENPYARGIARTIRGLFGNSGNTAEQTAAHGEMRGGMDTAIQLANDFYNWGTDLVGKRKDSLEKIHAVLDPELAKTGVTEASLTGEEKAALDTLRQVSDLINDSNYAQGKISYKTWSENRGGKYIARAYEPYDLPPEVSEALRAGGGKQDLGQFKKRTGITDWKTDNAIRDPFYLMGKRLQQTMQNDAVAQYGSFIAKNPAMISDVEKAGFTKLGDVPEWGDLAGKWMRQDVLEGIKGFYSNNKAIQGAYDALNAFDRNKVRQFLKKTKTVYNPATRLGNQIGNRTFALLNGINPFTFEKNIQGYAKKALQENDPMVRYMRSQGLLGTDMSKKEIVKSLADLGVTEKSVLKKVDNWITEGYGNADDHSKIAAFKYWIDKGMSTQEAATKVRNGFQDYNTVGLFYDLGAKIPVLGNAFVRFQGDLTRILKNAALENPLGTMGLVGGIKLMGDFASAMSGESPEDRQTRESRLGTPTVPFTSIPLAFQTPFGEINAARLFGIYAQTPASGESGITNQISRMMPVQIPTNKDDLLKAAGSDVMVGPIISTLTDTDFRGKSIADPNQTKYSPSTLTDSEQNMNRLRYLERSYMPSFGNTIEDVADAAAGQPDFYGKERSVPQALARAAGVKVEQFGHDQAVAARDKEAAYQDNVAASIQTQINQVEKQLATGKIDEATANSRIAELKASIPARSSYDSGSATADGGVDPVAEFRQKYFGAGGSTEGGSVGSQSVQGAGSVDEVIPTDFSGIRQSKADNKYYFIAADGSRKEFDNSKKAQQSYAKQLVDTGKQEKAQAGDMVYYLDSYGDTQSYNVKKHKNDVASAQYSLDADKAKRNDDFKTWADITNKEIDRLTASMDNLDPSTQMDDILKVENKIADMSASLQKYSSYKGFTKPKKAKNTYGKASLTKSIGAMSGTRGTGIQHATVLGRKK